MFWVFLLGFVSPWTHTIKKNHIFKKPHACHVQKTEAEVTEHDLDTRLKLTGLFYLQVVLGVLIMLVFMSFNVWAILVVLLGVTLGYYVFESAHDDPNSKTGCCC